MKKNIAGLTLAIAIVFSVSLFGANAAHAASGPMVSITFDDGYSSQYNNAAPVLEQAGYRGTFYITTDNVRSGDRTFMTPNQVANLHNRGHEIGGHTITHPDLATLSNSQIRREVRDSKTDIQNMIGGSPISNFAYPYGSYNDRVINILKQEGYTTARGVEGGLNFAGANPYTLLTAAPEANTPLSEIKGAINWAADENGWLIISFHDVKKNGDQYSNTPAYFRNVVNYIKQKGIPVVTVQEGWNRLNQ